MGVAWVDGWVEGREEEEGEGMVWRGCLVRDGRKALREGQLRGNIDPHS